MSGAGCRPTVCNIFFQEKEFMNIENFYALKRLEWQANKEHLAAIKIQTFFRRWLTQKNMKLLSNAALKIQNLIRGFLARRRVKAKREELERQKEEEIKNKAATAIQAHWKGCYIRKNCLDYQKYKDIQGKNSEYAHCLEAMNELETLSTCSTTSITSEEKDNILKKLLDSTSLTEILKLSPSRICELQAHIENINRECIKNGRKPRRKSLTLEDTLRRECERSNTGPVEPISDPEKAYGGSKFHPEDFQRSGCGIENIDALFPDFSGVPGIIQPEKEKVEKLREAIMKLRSNIEMHTEVDLTKKHYLLRTYQNPGVLSDICTHELTPAEQQLKDLKFWRPPLETPLFRRSTSLKDSEEQSLKKSSGTQEATVISVSSSRGFNESENVKDDSEVKKMLFSSGNIVFKQWGWGGCK